MKYSDGVEVRVGDVLRSKSNLNAQKFSCASEFLGVVVGGGTGELNNLSVTALAQRIVSPLGTSSWVSASYRSPLCLTSKECVLVHRDE